MGAMKPCSGSEAYLKDRVDGQLGWLSKQAARNKRWFLVLRLFQIILAGYVTVMASQSSLYPWVPFSLTLAGTLITAMASWEGINGYQGLWVRYRQASEKLEREKNFYLTDSPPYRQAPFATDQDAAFATFVTRVESILGEELDQWSQAAAHTPKGSNEND